VFLLCVRSISHFSCPEERKKIPFSLSNFYFISLFEQEILFRVKSVERVLSACLRNPMLNAEIKEHEQKVRRIAGADLRLARISV
jgi:hypothetical protein